MSINICNIEIIGRFEGEVEEDSKGKWLQDDCEEKEDRGIRATKVPKGVREEGEGREKGKV